MLRLKLAIPILLIVVFPGCKKQSSTDARPTEPTQAAQTRNSVDVVKATAQRVEIKPGETADAIVRIEVEKGYHVNANPPTFPYLKATELDIAKTSGFSLAFIVYPDALTKTFSFAEKPLAVYEGAFEIKARFKVEKTTKLGAQNLPAKLRVQACDDQVCYAPGTLEVNIPFDIK